MFEQVADPDCITYETLVAASAMAGEAERAEAWFSALQSAGFHPRDYSFVSLIAAHRWVLFPFPCRCFCSPVSDSR